VNSGKTKSFVLWTLLEIVGQFATLRLIDAGNLLHYQHYRIFDGPPLFLVILSIQSLFVFFAIFQTRTNILKWLKETFQWWQVGLILFLFVISSAALSSQLSVYFTELFFGSFVQFVHLMNIVLITMNFPQSWKIPDWKGPLLPSVLVLVLGSILNLWSYQNHPHITDEVIYWMQAKFFANGALKLTAPPVVEGFQIYMMQVDGSQWYPATPPGWSFILAVGMRFAVPWLVNPLIAALNLLLAYAVLKQIYDEAIANTAIWMLGVSPWYIFLAMSFMNHMLTLTSFLLAAWGILRSRKTETMIWPLMGGIVAGYTCWIRPLDGAIVILLLGLWILFSPNMIRIGVPFIGGALIACIPLLIWNVQFTGNPFQFPINSYLDEYFGKNSNAYGFGPDRGMGWAIDPYPGHSPRDGILNALLNLFSINVDLFGWGTGSIVLAAAFVLRGKLQKEDWWMLAIMIGVFVAYFFYYFSGGPDFGARYWFLMIVPFVVFTARWIHQFPQTRNAAMILSLIALLLYVPWRAIDKYHYYWNMRPDVRNLAIANSFGRSLILIRGESHPDYSSAAIYNPLDLNADEPIYAWDRDSSTRELLVRYYSDRPVWILNGPTITRDGYTIVQSPQKIERKIKH
jgi:hypothetical protein